MTSFDKNRLVSQLAVYRLVSLQDGEFQQLLHNLNNDNLRDGFPLACISPGGDNLYHSLEEAIARHCEARPDQTSNGNANKYHPYIFFLIDQRNYQKAGILAVSLDSKPAGVANTMRLPIQSAINYLLKIARGDSSWGEIKDEMQGPLDAATANLEQPPINNADAPPSDRPYNPLIQYRFCVYKVENHINMPLLIERLNGKEAFYGRGVSNCTFQIPPWFPFISIVEGADNLEAVKTMHYRYIGKYPQYHPDIVIAAEQTWFEEGTVQIINLAQEEPDVFRMIRVEHVETWLTGYVAGTRLWNS